MRVLKRMTWGAWGLCLSHISLLGAETTIQHFDERQNLLTVRVHEAAPAMPLAVVAVLDVSGSMNLESKENDTVGEGKKFSRLDLVKHGMNTVTEMMRDGDILSVMTFSDTVKTVVGPTEISARARADIQTKVLNLQPGGGTNLWSSITEGLARAKEIRRNFPRYNVNLVILTDGQPSPEYEPLLPYDQELLNVVEQPSMGTNPISIHMIGVSNAPNPSLLSTIARMGNGTFAYISDGSMVGAVFIHLISNLINTFGNNYWLGTNFVGRLGVGQTREVLIDKKTSDITSGSEVSQSSRDHFTFINFLEKLGSLMARKGDAQAFANKVSSAIEDENILSDFYDEDEAKGQVGKAIASEKTWNDWGKTYIASIIFAHKRQEKINFFDASMQSYSSYSLERLLAKGRQAFATIKQPKPSLAAQTSNSAPANIAGVGGGSCFGADSLVDLESGLTKRIDNLIPGDLLKGGAKVKYVIKFQGDFDLYDLGTGSATPWHPFRFSGEEKWQFPAEALKSLTKKATVVYNLILDSQHIVSMGNAEFVTLGHGLTEPVAAHPYFGDMAKVLADFEGLAKDGFVEVNQFAVKRGSDGLIVGYKF